MSKPLESGLTKGARGRLGGCATQAFVFGVFYTVVMHFWDGRDWGALWTLDSGARVIVLALLYGALRGLGGVIWPQRARSGED